MLVKMREIRMRIILSSIKLTIIIFQLNAMFASDIDDNTITRKSVFVALF